MSGSSRCRNVGCFSVTRPHSRAARGETGQLRRPDEGAYDVDVQSVGEVAERQPAVRVGPRDLPTDALRAEGPGAGVPAEAAHRRLVVLARDEEAERAVRRAAEQWVDQPVADVAGRVGEDLGVE